MHPKMSEKIVKAMGGKYSAIGAPGPGKPGTTFREGDRNADPLQPNVPREEGKPSPAGPLASHPQTMGSAAARVNVKSIPSGGTVPLADPGIASKAAGAQAAPRSFRVPK
jgi:hypothetical protein